MFECVKCGYKNEHCARRCEICSWPFSKDAWPSTNLKIKKISIDTGCVNAKRANADLNTLESWASMGRIEIQRSDAFMEELKGHDRVIKAKEIPSHPPLFKFGDTLGGDGVLSGPDLSQYVHKVLFPTTRNLTPNQKNDIRHLSQHIKVGGDIFVTLNTNDFIKHGKQATFAERGIWVFTPTDAVHLLRQLYSWE